MPSPIRYLGSFSQFWSTGLATYTEARSKGVNPWVAAAMGFAAGTADAFSTFNFQGASLDRQKNVGSVPEVGTVISRPRPRATTREEREYEADLYEPGLSISQSLNEDTTILRRPLSRPDTTSSYAKQFGYLLVDGGKHFINRIFLLSHVFIMADKSTNSWPFYVVLAVSVSTKLGFAMSNETYENMAKIAHNHRPFYKKAYKSFFGKSPARLETLRVIGSLDHTIMEGILPLIFFLPDSIVKQLGSDEPEAIGVLTGIVAMSLALGLIIFPQAYLFEGGRTHQFLASSELRRENELEKTSDCSLAILQKTTLLMGPFHGIVTATNVFFSLFLLLKHRLDEAALWPVCVISALLNAFPFAYLTHKSEVREVEGKVTREAERRTQLRAAAIEEATARHSTLDDVTSPDRGSTASYGEGEVPYEEMETSRCSWC